MYLKYTSLQLKYTSLPLKYTSHSLSGSRQIYLAAPDRNTTSLQLKYTSLHLKYTSHSLSGGRQIYLYIYLYILHSIKYEFEDYCVGFSILNQLLAKI